EAEGRRPIAIDGAARDVFQDYLGGADVGAEFRWRLAVHPEMRQAMAGDFVAGTGDATNQGGMALRDPAQGEEGRPHARVAEDFEYDVRVAFDARRITIPVRPGTNRRQGLHLVIILNVDRQRVDDGSRGGSVQAASSKASETSFYRCEQHIFRQAFTRWAGPLLLRHGVAGFGNHLGVEVVGEVDLAPIGRACAIDRAGEGLTIGNPDLGGE